MSDNPNTTNLTRAEIENFLRIRKEFKKQHMFEAADLARKQLNIHRVRVIDKPDGTSEWEIMQPWENE